MDLLAENNICGQTLLRLVSRGSSIIAELLRLSDHIPTALQPPEEGASTAGASADRDASAAKYLPILFDFKYLKAPEMYDKAINTSMELGDLDDEFYETHEEVLGRFYHLFESMFNYIQDYNKYLADLEEGFYIQHTLEGVLLDAEGRQLMCEALFLLGVMLLLLDRRLPGPVRERLVIAHYRHKGESPGVPIVELAKLTRDSGYRHGIAGAKRPASYPEEYLSRFPVPQRVVQMVLGRLRSDDVYALTRVYPSPEQRPAALAAQASLLYVVLYFTPRTLLDAKPVMREIVDKHFADNWVVPVYMGWTADLTAEWERYKAAKEALSMDAVTPAHVKEILSSHRSTITALGTKLDDVLTEGVLTEAYVIDSTAPLLELVRSANICLRWILLHRRSEIKKWRDMVHAPGTGFPDRKPLVELLLRTALLEYKLKAHLRHLLSVRQVKWDEDRLAASTLLAELSSYFSGSAALTRVEKDEGLQQWFATLQSEVTGLQPGDGVLAGRKIRQLLRALDEVTSFDTIDTNANVKEFLGLIKGHLTDMVRTSNITDGTLADVNTLSDFSYAWEIVQEEFTADLHDRIQADAGAVRAMRALFLKLTSVLDVPLVRITQAGGRDALSVAEYYSGELVAFLRTVLGVIPIIVFTVLKDLISLQARDMKPLPVKLESSALREYAQLDQRAELARRTYEISMFTEGVLAMEKTLLGVIQVDPRAILNDGIRKHLADQIAKALHVCLAFDTKPMRGKDPRASMEKPLENLKSVLGSIRESFEYAQDYIGVHGLKMWQEELTRVLKFNAEQDANRFTRRKVLPETSKYQSRAAPLPLYVKPPAGDASPPTAVTCLGRVMEALLSVTHPSRTIYGPGPTGGAWYDQTGREIVGKGTFALLASALGVPGLLALDSLLGHTVEAALTRLLRSYAAELKAGAAGVLEKVAAELQPISAVSVNVVKSYSTLCKSLGKKIDGVVDSLVSIGSAQLLRRGLANELRFMARLDANTLAVAVQAVNDSLLGDIRRHFSSSSSAALPGDDNPLLAAAAVQVEAVGLSEPLAAVYLSVEPALQPTLGLWLALTTVAVQPRLAYDRELGNLTARKSGEALDGGPLVAGVVTLLKQVHPAVTDDFFSFTGQYVRSSVHASIGSAVSAAVGDAGKTKELMKAAPTLPADAVGAIYMTLAVARVGHVPERVLHAHVPAHLFDLLQAPPGSLMA